MTAKKLFLASEEGQETGQALLRGTSGVWESPISGSISVVVVEGGQDGAQGGNWRVGQGAPDANGGLGGRVRYINNVPVTRGQQIDWELGPRLARFGQIITGQTGGVDAGKAGDGSAGIGTGVNQTYPYPGGAGGAPAVVFAPGRTLAAVPLRTGRDKDQYGNGLWPGGGGGGGRAGYGVGGAEAGQPGRPGAGGAIYIIWPGDARMFPDTRTASETPDEASFSAASVPGEISSLATDGQGTWMGVDNSNAEGRIGSIYRSTDNGHTFSKIASPIPLRLGDIAYGNGVWIVAANARTVNTQLNYYRSTDNGLSWQHMTVDISVSSGTGFIAATFGNGMFVMLATGMSSSSQYAWISRDNGISFASTGQRTASSDKWRRVDYVGAETFIGRMTSGNTFITTNGFATSQAGSAPYIASAAVISGISIGLPIVTSRGEVYSSSDYLATTINLGPLLAGSQPSHMFGSAVDPCAIKLHDRILMLSMQKGLETRDGQTFKEVQMPFELAPDVPVRACSDGFDAIVSLQEGAITRHFRSSVYVG